MSPAIPILLLHFLTLSFLAIGGVNSVIPEIHRLVVDTHHWMDASTFSALFAIAQAAPGPNMLIVTLIGWQVAGALGATVTTLAMCGPSSLLAWAAGRFWLGQGHLSGWRRTVQHGLGAVTIGLVFASGALLANTTNHPSWLWLLSLATMAFTLRSRRHPLWTLLVGAIAGIIGLG